jgi:long-chain acyl-CoA synthetase
LSETHTPPAVWQSLYGVTVDPAPAVPTATVLDAFEESVRRDPDAPALHYFGATLSRVDLDELGRKLAVVLHDEGVRPDGRVALSMQNTPVFVAALLASWRLGAIVVPVNPMVSGDELAKLLVDSAATVLVAHPAMRDVVAAATPRLERPLVALWSEPADLAGDLPLPFGGSEPTAVGDSDLLSRARAVGDREVEESWAGVEDVALLTYTSGTTGPSKGAMGTHANLAFQALDYHQWFASGADCDTVVLTVAPLFHITGLGAHVAFALGNGHPMVLTYRFEPATVLSLVATYRPTFAIGAITAFISMLDRGGDDVEALRSLGTVFSGGAAVPASVVERYFAATGHYIHNIYGLTETTSACIGTPLGETAPVDEASGALSIGVPMGGTTVTIVDDEGRPVAPGVQGEIVVAGPQVVAGYWNRPDETANAFREFGVHTGDVGVMDERGWVYVVDRKKDLVVVSGYKVWPRDVEDVLYQHPAVSEAAVVGQPDDYRGETLHAYLTLRAGKSVTQGELVALCREKLSAYKVPTHFTFVDELPKTSTGKILRRALRG